MASDELIAIKYVHIVFCILEAISLGVFIFFVFKYTKRFKDCRDPYTVACFIFIILAIVVKLLLKIYQFEPFGCGDNCSNIVFCSQQVSYYFPTGLLTIAILINVFRWLKLIKQYKVKNYRMSFNED